MSVDTYHESVFAGLDKDVANASEFVKESLNIALTRIIGQIAEKHAGSFSRRHDGPQSRIQPRAARKSGNGKSNRVNVRHHLQYEASLTCF